LLDSDHPRLRFEAVQAVGQAGLRALTDDLVAFLEREPDRVAFYAAWNQLRELATPGQRQDALGRSVGGARLGILLSLLADDALASDQVAAFRQDDDPRVADIAEQWMIKTGAAKPLIALSPEPGAYAERVMVQATTELAGHRITYTVDGSVPTGTSKSFDKPLMIERTTTLKLAVLRGNDLARRVFTAEYQIVPPPEYSGRRFIHDVTTPSGRFYEMEYRGLRVGQRIYTDRNYAITQLPDGLHRMPFLRVANGDDRSTGERWLSFRSDVELEILVGVDTRNDAPLRWMKVGEPDGFQETELIVQTDDADFRLYRKPYSAGEVVLGGNTNSPSDSGRGNYIVAFDRKLLSPPPSPVTQQQVLAAMPTADPERGRELFLHPRGAGCVKCHAMQGSGRLLAPDLSDLGDRAKTPDAIIESILQPSKVITEGFAQQKILTIDGNILAGAVIEESARIIKLVGSDGEIKSVSRDEIEQRVGTKVSPMPDGFDQLMSAQQIADIVAWLMTQKIIGDRGGFSFRDLGDRLDIFFESQRIATYLKRHPKLTRRALVNITTPSGIPVTRNFPPRKPEDIDPGYRTEDGIIHPVLHSGLWISFGDVAGNDYWRLRSKVDFDGFFETPAGGRSSARFAVKNRLLAEDGQTVVCEERTRYHFARVAEGLLLTIRAEYSSDDGDFYFGDQEESGLAVRVASPLRVRGGNGTILNDRGQRNGAEVWGKPARWFDYFGVVDRQRVGILVAPSPENPRSSWLHARDYGVVVANPFPRQPKERREPYVKTPVRRGETYRLAYAILIHEQPADAAFDREAAYQRMIDALAAEAIEKPDH
jgi:putative heme-binding domain-containing protein